MIDKEKLLKEIKSLGYYEEMQIIKTIKNFPEEPEIDFDALYYEWSEKPMDWSESRSPYDQARSFRDFLKSKNLTVPKPVEIPVNKIWKLKEKYVNYFESKGIDSTQFDNYTEEPECVELYDLHEEPDYSVIPKGSIVEIKFVGGNGNNCGYVNGITNKSISIGFHMLYNSGNSTTINFYQIESIVILKLAKE